MCKIMIIIVVACTTGKGSQCRRLAEQYNLEHISCGELMRHQKVCVRCVRCVARC
jgi:adenylate kinase family enzyme